MTKHEILEALNAIRSTGKDFFAACDKLASMIENMAAANDRLLSIIADHEATIRAKDEKIARLAQDNDEAHSRAIKSENNAWEMQQKVNTTQAEVETVNSAMASLSTQLRDAQAELAELRPFRSLSTDLSRERELVVALREEVRKLHEVILTVATSVDPVVNPSKPKVPNETYPHPVPNSLTAAE